MDSPESPGRRTPRAPEKEHAMALAQERRQAILVRARRIRRTVAALTATLFSVAFLVIFVQLASGHDPALVANAKRAAAEKADKASTSTESSESNESTGTTSSSTGEESSASGASEESSSSASAVTTSQS